MAVAAVGIVAAVVGVISKALRGRTPIVQAREVAARSAATRIERAIDGLASLNLIGDREREHRSASQLRFDLDLAPVGFDDLLSQSQTQT